ncbi:MAG: hypothetical protein U5K54_06510 [Cytophagales bacterium]|nr:hypothetical protein [Cytophagales bacterium]
MAPGRIEQFPLFQYLNEYREEQEGDQEGDGSIEEYSGDKSLH